MCAFWLDIHVKPVTQTTIGYYRKVCCPSRTLSYLFLPADFIAFNIDIVVVRSIASSEYPVPHFLVAQLVECFEPQEMQTTVWRLLPILKFSAFVVDCTRWEWDDEPVWLAGTGRPCDVHRNNSVSHWVKSTTWHGNSFWISDDMRICRKHHGDHPSVVANGSRFTQNW